MLKSSPGKSRKKTAFVPRLAFGCVGLGMGVIPLSAACSSADKDSQFSAIADASSEADAPSIGIRIAMGDASSDPDAQSVGIVPYVPDASSEADASSIGIVPAMPESGENGD